MLIVPAVCNPFGGLGLTGGLVDIEGLYECMIGVHDGKADDSIFDKYSEIRREKYKTIVDPVSTENIKRLYTQDPEKALETDSFLKLLNDIKDDPKAQIDFMRGPMALMYDFTQHYKSGTLEKNNVASHVETVAVVGPE
jgi:2-polyprenyl-6-methoxyphenol hydroxylase-like FAD-dependent oxidoreductase